MARRKRSAGRLAGVRQPVVRSLREYVRAVGGGLLVGLPLLFTMEMWFHAFLLPGWKILVLLAVGAAIVVGYTLVSGFRREASWSEVVVDAIETLGIAIVVAAAAMVLLGRIEPGTGVADAAGKVALEAIAVAFGVSLAGTELRGVSRGGDDDDAGGSIARPSGPFGRLFVAAGGALLFALNVAPTDEIPVLSLALDWGQALLLMAATYLITLAIVFYADFRGGRAPDMGEGPLEWPWTETAAAYAVSLAVALLLLWAFGRTDDVALPVIASQVVILAVVASFGAAVGRLLVGGEKPATGGRL
jgi:putative integral membrane protein (TIGR02587 family)